MARGRPRADLPPDDPDQWIHLTQRGRARLMPDLVPALLCWLNMHETVQCEVRAELMSRSNRLSPAAREMMVQATDELVRGLRLVASLVTQQFRRSDWRMATNALIDRVNPIRDEEEPPAESEG